MITPTEREARISARNHGDSLLVFAEQLRINSKTKNILLKMGDEDLLILASDHVGAMNSASRELKVIVY